MRTFIGGRQVDQTKVYHKCKNCGHLFYCNESCHSVGEPPGCEFVGGHGPIGPCCDVRDKEDGDCSSCWEDTDYYEDWLEGEYKK